MYLYYSTSSHYVHEFDVFICNAGADTGFVVRGGVDKIIEAGGLGAALRPPVGPGQSPGGGPGGEAPGSSWVFVYFEGKTRLKIVLFF